MGPRDGLDVMVKRKIPVVQTVASLSLSLYFIKEQTFT
jgi:hypothetical protein